MFVKTFFFSLECFHQILYKVGKMAHFFSSSWCTKGLIFKYKYKDTRWSLHTYYLQLLKNTHAIHSRQLARKQTLGNFRKIGKLATTGSTTTTTSHSLGGRRGLRMIQVVAAALFGITMHMYGIVVYEVGWLEKKRGRPSGLAAGVAQLVGRRLRLRRPTNLTSFTVHFDIQLCVGEHSAAKGFKLCQTRIIGGIVIVLCELI